MRSGARGEFVEFVRESSPGLLHLGWLLCGDAHAAEELVQETYEEMFKRWTRVEQPLAYARRVLVNRNTERWRRTRKELLTGDGVLPESAEDDESLADADNRRLLIGLLSELPDRERQVVVLRHYLDLSERQVADLLGVSVGTVKSSASRGLATMRAALPTSREGVQ